MIYADVCEAGAWIGENHRAQLRVDNGDLGNCHPKRMTHH